MSDRYSAEFQIDTRAVVDRDGVEVLVDGETLVAYVCNQCGAVVNNTGAHDEQHDGPYRYPLVQPVTREQVELIGRNTRKGEIGGRR